MAVGVDVGPCRVIRPRPRHVYGGLEEDLGMGRMGPRWESFFIGEMPSRRVKKSSRELHVDRDRRPIAALKEDRASQYR